MKTNRRNFLKRTAFTTAGIGAVSILPSAVLVAKKYQGDQPKSAIDAPHMLNDSMAQKTGFFRSQILFEAGTQGYYIYRIASLVSTRKGTLLAFCEGRKGRGGDWDPIDIFMRRSTDSGKTWEPFRLIMHHDDYPSKNAMPIVDYITGEIHLLFNINYERCYYTKSGDDGITWSDPFEITEVINSFKEVYHWLVEAPGPGHGIQLKNGRLVVPFWLSEGTSVEFGSGNRGHRPSIVVSVYSDDHGKTWKAGDVAVPDNEITVNPNETACVQLADGRVMFNARNESINYRRLFTYSEDGAINWSTPVFADPFFEPICFGSMCRYSLQPFQSKNRILFCNPDSRHNPWEGRQPSRSRSARSRHRSNLTIRMSYDEGHTWPISKVIDPDDSRYSDIAVTPDGLIHVFYEGGSMPNACMSVASFDLQWLTDGRDELHRRDKPLNTFL